MDIEKKDILELELLKHVEESPILNNRMAASKLGCSVKLAHEMLSKMVGKGFFHVKKHHSRRWDYFLTPKGIAEKARLTYEFLEFSMQFYREARKRSSQLCKDLAQNGIKKVSFIGAGDLAEIVYLGVKEWGLELEDVYAESSKKQFMGVEIKPYSDLIRQKTSDERQSTTINQQLSTNKPINSSTRQHIIVCLYDKSQPTKNNKFLPEELSEQLSTIKHQLTTSFYWIF